VRYRIAVLVFFKKLARREADVLKSPTLAAVSTAIFGKRSKFSRHFQSWKNCRGGDELRFGVLANDSRVEQYGIAGEMLREDQSGWLLSSS
jgi:hypothetical protein